MLSQYDGPLVEARFESPGYYINTFTENTQVNRTEVFGGYSEETYWGLGTDINESAFSQWLHVAAARQSGELRFWVNGARITGPNNNPSFSNPPPTIAENYTSNKSWHLGVDVGQLRLTPKKAIYWNDTINVPTRPFIVPSLP